MTEEKLVDRKVQKALVSRLRLPGFLKGSSNVSVPAPVEIVAPGSGPDRMALPIAAPRTRPSFYLLSFIGVVLLPALLATIYLLFWASDIYVAEARFAVRKAMIAQMAGDKTTNASSAATAGLGTGAAGGGMVEQEAHIVANYLRSRAAIEDIQEELNVIEIFQRPGADFWARLKRDPSKEELVDYWNSMVSTYVDGPSGVVTVAVKAFRPEDARQLVQAFIRSSERLANQLSERARRDAMQKSEAEVRRTEAMVQQALADLRKYRDEEGFITPLMEATSTSKLLAEVMSDRIKLQNDYFVAARVLSPDAPSVQNLKSRLEGLDTQIEKLKGQLTNRSTQSRSVSASLVKFEELELRRVFAEKMYSMSQDALGRARLRAEQQAVYVSVFVPPYLPQEAQFPKRYSMSSIIFLGLLLIWGVGALMIAAVEDHKL